MIYIIEDKSIKVPGVTSLHIISPYNPELIQIIKSNGPAHFHKKTKVWEVPITSLATLLDSFTYYDDITLKIKEEEQKKTKNKPILKYKTKPYDYQMESIEKGLNEDKWLLLDAPGLGKTISMIYLAEELKAQQGLEHCLIVCGVSSLRANWEKEIKKHSNESSIVIGKEFNRKGNVKWATIPQRAEQFNNKIEEFFIIVNIETMRSNDVIKAIMSGPNKIDMVVIDEAHRIKGNESQQSKNLLKLKEPKYKVALTGTLMLNGPLDTYVPLKWLDIERGTFSAFRSHYCVYGGVMGKEIVGYKNMDMLKDIIDEYSLRRTKDVLDLPPKNIVYEYIELNDKHRTFYDNIVNGIKNERMTIEIDNKNVLSLVTRLRQATSSPMTLTESDIPASKLERAKELVEELVFSGEKVVIVSTFKDPIYKLAEMLEKHKPLIVTGDVDDETTFHRMRMFQEDDEHYVFMGTSQKMGTGFDLYRARYMVCIDYPWTPGEQRQTEDRIHRIGTTDPVFIYRLIAENTIDEKIIELLELKEALSDYVIDDKVTEESLTVLRKYIQEL